ncbi:MAG: polysaccharide deacetylase family protein [Nannocystaceae bacterium]
MPAIPENLRAPGLPRSRALIFALVAATPPLMILLWRWSVAAALALFLLAHAAILLPIFLPRLRWLGPVVTTFAPEPADAKVVWLTIDDGPDPDDTPVILDLLDRYGARATFFLKGELAAAHPAMVQAMVERGHQVANHSHTHPTKFFWCAPPATVEGEIRRCNAAIAGAGAPEPALFRAPVGIKSPALHPVLGRLGMRLCAWSIRAFDGVTGFDPAVVEARVLGQLAPGAILCMHQGVRDRGGAPLSAEGLGRVLAGLHARGYRCEIPALDRLR